jgi:nucleoside-diphosphate-sugar epimerase
MESCLITSSQGFLGTQLYHGLKQRFQLSTLGLKAKNDFRVDLSQNIPVFPTPFDWVVHNAGKAHVVPKTSAEAASFYEVNVLGTIHLLKGLSSAPLLPKTFIFISSVSVYGLETGLGIAETLPLLGTSPYAKSKIEAENIITTWGKQNDVNVIILRLPLVVGTHPPGNLQSIANAIKKGIYIRIRNNHAQKSMVLGPDIAALIPTLEGKSGIYNLTDGIHPTFDQREDAIAKGLKQQIWFTLPISFFTVLARIGDLWHGFPLNTQRLHNITKSLTFDDHKARKMLSWQPEPALPVLASMQTWT